MKIFGIFVLMLTATSAHANPYGWLMCINQGNTLSALMIDLNQAGRSYKKPFVKIIARLEWLNDTSDLIWKDIPAKSFDKMMKKGKINVVLSGVNSKSESIEGRLELTQKSDGVYDGKYTTQGYSEIVECTTSILEGVAPANE